VAIIGSDSDISSGWDSGSGIIAKIGSGSGIDSIVGSGNGADIETGTGGGSGKEAGVDAGSGSGIVGSSFIRVAESGTADGSINVGSMATVESRSAETGSEFDGMGWLRRSRWSISTSGAVGINIVENGLSCSSVISSPSELTASEMTVMAAKQTTKTETKIIDFRFPTSHRIRGNINSCMIMNSPLYN
jgi:hypothetical protein